MENGKSLFLEIALIIIVSSLIYFWSSGLFAGYHQPNNFAQGGLDSFNLLKDPTQMQQGFPLGSEKFYNFTCGRIDLMGNIVTKSAPYLYPFVIEFSLIIAAILLVMWLRIGKNPR